MSLPHLIDALGEHAKCLLIDKQLSSAINSLIPFSQLKRRANIQSVYWFQDSLNFNIGGEENLPVTLLIKSDLHNVQLLQTRIKELSAMNAGDLQIDLIITDDYSKSFKYQLEQLGVIGEISSISEWKLWIDIDGVMSLNLKQFERTYLYKTSNSCFKLASLLNEHLKENPKLRITNVLSKGGMSSKFVTIFKDLKENEVNQMGMEEKKEFLKIEEGLYEQLSSGKQCDLIVLERNLDYLSVVLPQLSYSGIIDEVSNIDINTTKLNDETIFLSKLDDNEDGKTGENNTPLYDLLKHMNFGLACDYLNNKAKSLQVQQDNLVKRVDPMSSALINEVQHLEFLKKEVSVHTKISEAILNKLGTNDNSQFNSLLDLQQDIILSNIGYSTSVSKTLDLIYQFFPIDDVIRVLSLISIVFNGLREKDFQNVSTEIIESYGIKYLIVLQNLLKIGVLLIRGDQPIIKSFSALNSALKVVPDMNDSNDPLAQMMVYRGYVPIVARVLEGTLKPHERASWKDLDLSSIAGKTIEESLVKVPTNGGGVGGAALQSNSTVFLVMIGGVTYSEISAIRQWEEKFEKRHGVKKTVVVVTDGYINSRELLQSVEK